MKNLEFNLAFGGFYESLEDNFIDMEIENYLEYNEKSYDDIEYKIDYDAILAETIKNTPIVN